MNFKTSCHSCSHISEAGKGYWHLQKCEAYQELKKKREEK